MTASVTQIEADTLNCVPDPLHVPMGDARTRWSRVNIGEFIVGVPTPLTWGLWDYGTRRSGPEIYYRMGLATGTERRALETTEKITTVLFGWPVCNVDAMRHFIDRAGPQAGESFERNMLGELSPRTVHSVAKTRRLVSAVKTPHMLLTYPRKLRSTLFETTRWWQESTARASDAPLADAKAILNDAFERYPNVCVIAGSGGTVGGQIIFSQLENALPDRQKHLLTKIVSGGSGLAEARMLDALWSVAQGRSSMEVFLSGFGFYGTDVGECLNLSWRENPAALEPVLKTYRAAPAEFDPAKRHAQRERARRSALQELRAHVGMAKFAWIKTLLSYAEKMTQWREDGKTCTLRVHDTVRAAARAIGRNLVAAGHLQDPNDVFFLTREEINRAPFANMKETILFRRAKRAFYETIEIPDAFVGEPELQFRTQHDYDTGCDDATIDTVAGIGVSPGTAVGRTRIVADPAACKHFEKGDILVCRNTDPSWAPLFTLAGGIVTDMGGMLSHGAIIARELGVPCIVNTRIGTRALLESQLIHIDGSTGAIEVME